MREAYGVKLVEIGKSLPEMVVLDADVSKSTRTVYFAKEFPERFFNFGIAEQNMMAAAAGMAATGLVPFVNSFSFLTTYRAADQFRTSVVYPGLGVIVVASYGGLSDSFDGPTHQTIADIAWVRALPGLNVIVPADSIEVIEALPVLASLKKPVWIRLCREKTPVINKSDYKFQLGKAVKFREGKDIALIGCGIAVARMLDVVNLLVDRGYDPLLLSIPTIKPLDEKAIIEAAQKTKKIITCEEHNIIGGLGSAVCEVIAKKCYAMVERIGIPDTFAESGSYNDLLDRYGLSVENILHASIKMIQSN